MRRFKGMISPRLYPYFEGFLDIQRRKTGWLAIYIQERQGCGRFKRLARRNHFSERAAAKGAAQ